MTYPFALYVLSTGTPLGRFATREAATTAAKHWQAMPHPGWTRAPQTVILETTLSNL